MPGVSSRLSALAWGGFLLSILPGCVVLRPSALDRSSLAASARTPWIPPPEARTAPAAVPPPDLATREAGRPWTLPEVVDVALRNNPATRAAWARARAAAEDFGIQRAAYAPTVNLTARVSGSETDNSVDGNLTQRLSAGPGASLSWLLLDVGGRTAGVEAARQALWAANWSQNAAIQDAVLTTQRAYYQYVANQATLEARRASLHDARVHLQAAEGRHRAGVATIADVLQARTVAAQAMLALQTAEGQLATARGSLATSMGVPANTPFEVEAFPADVPMGEVGEQIDRLIEQALGNRPDLAAARAEALAREADAKRARADGLPTVTLTSTADLTASTQDPAATSGRGERSPAERADASLTAALLLQVPLYNGGIVGHRVERARALAEAARENARSLQQQVVLQVFTSYHAVGTAAQKVRTSDELLASATQSLNVAEGRYREGVGTTVDVVTAQTALADARAQRVQARLEWYTSLAQLARDAGLLEASGANPFAASAAGRSPGATQER